jgi:hypothetical protein
MFSCQCDANDGERTRFPLLPRFIHGHLTRAEELAARGHCQSGNLAPVQQANGLAITIERPFLFALASQLIAQRSECLGGQCMVIELLTKTDHFLDVTAAIAVGAA